MAFSEYMNFTSDIKTQLLQVKTNFTCIEHQNFSFSKRFLVKSHDKQQTSDNGSLAFKFQLENWEEMGYGMKLKKYQVFYYFLCS